MSAPPKHIESRLIARPGAGEQGLAQDAVLELDNPNLSVFGKTPFARSSTDQPVTMLQMAASAIVKGYGPSSLMIRGEIGRC